MRSRPSGSKLRLSRLFSLLGSACLVKLVVLGLLMNNCLPDFLRDQAADEATAATVEQKPQARAEATAPASPKKEAAPEAATPAKTSEVVAESEPLSTPPRFAAKMENENPQGAAAAQLAAAAKPRREYSAGYAMPKPQLARPGQSAFAGDIVNASLPTPPPLGAPLAPAGEPAPLVTAMPDQKKPVDQGLADMLGLRQLPIPGLGSVQVAHAAAMDMPVPQSPGKSGSPFAPAEQLAPTQGATGTQQGAGTPLPPRSGQVPRSDLPPLPNSKQAAGAQSMPPVPTVAPAAKAHDPNEKAQELARQQQDVLILRQQMDQRLKDLEAAEKKMKDMIREAKDLEDKKIRNLIQMYANMKPRTAAQALENMEERVAIRILSGMAPKQSGEILTYTDPGKTAKLTELLTRMRMPE